MEKQRFVRSLPDLTGLQRTFKHIGEKKTGSLELVQDQLRGFSGRRDSGSLEKLARLAFKLSGVKKVCVVSGRDSTE